MKYSYIFYIKTTALHKALIQEYSYYKIYELISVLLPG